MAVTTNEDRLAIHCYTHAQETGQPITLDLVEQQLAELLGHEPACTCGLCTAATKVHAYYVFRVASAWTDGIAATRRRATR
ncbi:MAG TPA: hypothetical protein VN255_15740 [Mycobacterium sp.]|nr:hypothetical protein [Mycobacterium sp.]